jgi:hypothetical protein
MAIGGFAWGPLITTPGDIPGLSNILRNTGEIDPETGKPIERVYEPNPKHGSNQRSGPRGAISKEPIDGQGALDNSQPVPGKERQRVGTDSNGARVDLRRTLRQEFENTIREIWHGFAP